MIAVSLIEIFKVNVAGFDLTLRNGIVKNFTPDLIYLRDFMSLKEESFTPQKTSQTIGQHICHGC